jgi:hypothetical protein
MAKKQFIREFIDTSGFQQLTLTFDEKENPRYGLGLNVDFEFYLVEKLDLPLEDALEIQRRLWRANIKTPNDFLRDGIYSGVAPVFYGVLGKSRDVKLKFNNFINFVRNDLNE